MNECRSSAQIAGVLLAAGASTRFGSNKLIADFDGEPMAIGIARKLSALNLARLFAVCNPAHEQLVKGLSSLGFETIDNRQPAAGLSRSIALAAGAASRVDAAGLLVCLGDMPTVRRAHLSAIVEVGLREDCITASTDGENAMPPAYFPAKCFATLGVLEGQDGARSLLRNAWLVSVAPGQLADIDTVEDLARLTRSVQLRP
jgi:molybdenum cofactor cytidylyltransferase